MGDGTSKPAGLGRAPLFWASICRRRARRQLAQRRPTARTYDLLRRGKTGAVGRANRHPESIGITPAPHAAVVRTSFESNLGRGESSETHERRNAGQADQAPNKKRSCFRNSRRGNGDKTRVTAHGIEVRHEQRWAGIVIAGFEEVCDRCLTKISQLQSNRERVRYSVTTATVGSINDPIEIPEAVLLSTCGNYCPTWQRNGGQGEASDVCQRIEAESQHLVSGIGRGRLDVKSHLPGYRTRGDIKLCIGGRAKRLIAETEFEGCLDCLSRHSQQENAQCDGKAQTRCRLRESHGDGPQSILVAQSSAKRTINEAHLSYR